MTTTFPQIGNNVVAKVIDMAGKRCSLDHGEDIENVQSSDCGRPFFS